MNQKAGRYQVIDLPLARREAPNMLDMYWGKHSVYGLLEVDVTTPRPFKADHKACTGGSLSFTGYLVFCLARAIDEDKSVQALPNGRRQLVVFDDVDVALFSEREIGGTVGQ